MSILQAIMHGEPGEIPGEDMNEATFCDWIRHWTFFISSYS